MQTEQVPWRLMSGVTDSKRYRMVQRLASGGMGEVELAVRSEGGFRRLYAIKRLHAAMREDQSARGMFVDEARLAGLIRHPNVVSVLDVGEDERGPFLVMDFVEGISAASLLRWSAKNGVSLPVQLCLRLIRECALGLHAAHELLDDDGHSLGLVHRDVSPQNILIGFDGIARIADFGIAKAGGRTTRTTTGLLKGKAGYMSPEQLRFEEPDRRSDLFSLAIVLYELLAGQRLYRSESDMATARRILNEPPPDIDDVRADVPPEIVELLFACLAKDPATRPSSAQEMAQRLDQALAGRVADEGALDVGEYLREHFIEQRNEIQALLAEARSKASDPAVQPMPSVEVDLSEPAQPLRSRTLWMGIAIVALTALFVVGWSLGAFRSVESPAPEASSEGSPEATIEPPVVLPASPAMPAPAEAESAALLEGPNEEESTPAIDRRRRTRRPRAGESESGDGLFEWE